MSRIYVAKAKESDTGVTLQVVRHDNGSLHPDLRKARAIGREWAGPVNDRRGVLLALIMNATSRAPVREHVRAWHMPPPTRLLRKVGAIQPESEAPTVRA